MAVVVAATLITSEFFYDRLLKSSIRRSIYDGLEGVSSAVSDSISHFILETLTDTQAIAANIPSQALAGRQVKAVERYLGKMLRLYPKFQNGMFLLDSRGYLWADYPVHPKAHGRRFNFRDYYKKTMVEQKGVVGTPYRSARTGQPVLTFTAPIKDQQGRIVGLLGCSLQLLSPLALGGIRKEKIGNSGYIYVYDQSRLMILHPNDDRMLKRDVPPGVNRLYDAALAGKEGVGETINSRGVAMLLSLRRIPGTNWIVGAQQPKAEAFAPLADSRLRAFWVTVLGVLIATVMVIMAMRHITNPLERLRRAALELGRQGAEQSLSDIKSRDEIGELAETFKDMALKLHRSMESMKRVGLEWKLTFDSVRDAIFLLDKDRRIVRLNRAAQAILQCGEETESCTNFEERLSELGWWVQNQADASFQDSSLSSAAEVIITNGESCFELVSTPLAQDSNRDGGSIITARDITRRRRIENEKDQLQVQLLQAQKMEAVGTLAGGIAHDFNNILGSIMGNSELALAEARQGRPSPVKLEQILKSSERAKALVRQILTFSRKTESQFKPLDLNQAIARALTIIESTIPKMITVEVLYAKGAQIIGGDANQIEQVLLNLTGNAKDAMPEGGRLTLETISPAAADAGSGHPEAPGRDYVQMIISDNGEGMDQDTLEHVFEPFFTTKEVGAGTGLGLATVYGIVQSHQGHITCQSEPGAGTTFIISLPLLKAGEIPNETESADAHISCRGDETILLVDDERPLREIGREALEYNGYRILTAKSGEEALDVYAQKRDDIDLVILDIGMPGMGGYKCLKRLLAMDPEAKVLIASGYSHELATKPTDDTGAAGYIAKPFIMADLLQKVRDLLDG